MTRAKLIAAGIIRPRAPVEPGDPSPQPPVEQPLSTTGQILALLVALGEDERRVILEIAKRLTIGKHCYGVLDIAGDRRGRDWHREAEAELLDACVYLTCASLRDNSKGEKA
jgi:hypothetical protein